MKKILFILISSIFVSVSAYAGINDGSVAYYPFSGNANDASGHGYNGTVNGATLTTDRLEIQIAHTALMERELISQQLLWELWAATPDNFIMVKNNQQHAYMYAL